MTEDEAKDWIADRFGAAAVDRIAQMLSLIIAENERQNLISPSTVTQIWVRHALDSVQLVPLGRTNGVWIDVGAGGGFPGLLVAALRSASVILVEPRRKRAEFLTEMIDVFVLQNTRVLSCKVEAVKEKASVISARAVAPVGKLLAAAQQCATDTTRWVLPRGRMEPGELADIRSDWRGVFHVEQSITDAQSSVLIAEGVSRR